MEHTDIVADFYARRAAPRRPSPLWRRLFGLLVFVLVVAGLTGYGLGLLAVLAYTAVHP